MKMLTKFLAHSLIWRGKTKHSTAQQSVLPNASYLATTQLDWSMVPNAVGPSFLEVKYLC